MQNASHTCIQMRKDMYVTLSLSVSVCVSLSLPPSLLPPSLHLSPSDACHPVCYKSTQDENYSSTHKYTAVFKQYTYTSHT